MLYPSLQPRITTYTAAGASLNRWTLQHPKEMGRVLEVEIVGHESIGRPPNGMRSLVVHGFRPMVQLEWDYGLSSYEETWNGTAWVSKTEKPTMMALIDISQACENWPVQVEVSVGTPDPWWFMARTFRELQVVQDESAVLHKNLILRLQGESLMPSLPDFGGYFVPGYLPGTTDLAEGYFTS